MYEGDMDINANKHEGFDMSRTWLFLTEMCDVFGDEKDEKRTELLVFQFQSHKLTIYARVHMIRG